MEDDSNVQPRCTGAFKSNEHYEKCTKELSKEELLSSVIKCASFAAEKHRNQRRKDVEQTPYINHPLGLVMSSYNNLIGIIYDVPRIMYILFFLTHK